MGTVKSTLDTKNPPQLSEESLAELAALKDRPINYSDIPPTTEQEIKEMRRIAMQKRQKVMFSLRLQNSTILWWKRTIGSGYTTVMARLLEKATKHPEWIKECL